VMGEWGKRGRWRQSGMYVKGKRMNEKVDINGEGDMREIDRG